VKRAAIAALACLCAVASAQAQNLSADDLNNRLIHRRAVEAVIWGMPAVNLDLMLQAMIGSAKGKPNQIVYWSRLPDWKNQTLTPNPDVIYLMPFFNTKDAGPMVLEIPPADDGVINGTIMDAWQVPLEDVGPAGVDKGKGGKYLLLPPNHSAAVPDGYIALPSPNHQGYALLRSILRSGSDADVAKAATYGKRIKLYPLAQAANPPATTFVDAIDVVYDSTIPYDLRFFQSLDRVVQREPWLPRDRLMIDMLKSIGIEKGKPFNPDAKTEAALNAAAREAHAFLEGRYEGLFVPYFDISRWALPAVPDYLKASQDGFSDPNAYPFGDRGLVFTYAFFTPKHLGEGQFYLMTIKDKDGLNFDGSKSYRLTVPSERAGEPVLVGDGLRPCHPRPYPRHDPLRPRLAKPGPAKERGRLSGYLFRTESSGRQGSELGADQPERTVRGAVPLLRSRKAAVRQDLEVAGHRARRCSVI